MVLTDEMLVFTLSVALLTVPVVLLILSVLHVVPEGSAYIPDFVRQRCALPSRSSAHPLAAFAH
jgi:hypothetical protein